MRQGILRIDSLLSHLCEKDKEKVKPKWSWRFVYTAIHRGAENCDSEVAMVVQGDQKVLPTKILKFYY